MMEAGHPLHHRLPMKKLLIILSLSSLTAVLAAGCSTDENPITPDKMEQIRQQEGEERANFNPSATTPPPPSGQ